MTQPAVALKMMGGELYNADVGHEGDNSIKPL